MTSRIHLTGPNPVWIASLMLSLLAGCAAPVKPVGHYDDIVDRSVHQIEAKTTAHIKIILDTKGTGDGSYDHSRRFYADIKGEVQALIVRAETLEEGLPATPLINNLDVLQLQYDDLAALQQKPYDESAFIKLQGSFDKSFRTIVKHLIGMKWDQESPKDK